MIQVILGRGGGGTSETYSPVRNVKSAATNEKIILAWQNPEQNYYGVKIAMSPAAGNLAEPKTFTKETNTFTVTSLNSNTEYTFTFTSLDSKQQETSEKTSIAIKTAQKSAEDSGDTTSPQDVTGFKVEVEDLVATLKWKVSESKDVFGYFISYEEEKLKSGTIDTRSALTESMPKNTVFVSPETKKYSISVKSGRSYTFTVKAVDTSGNESKGVTSEKITIAENVGPELGTRTESLNYIFGTDSVAEITLTISREQWDELCTNYDKNPKNEDCVHADFEMKKGNNTWQISDIGMRLRGNTSRRRPQVDDKYYQAHFKLKFEEWCDDSGEERKLAGCMKGLNLKRFKDDPAYVREVFGYNYFRKNGIWTAPRAGYAHLFINIEEDGTAKKLDYGVYAMIEEINKQFLKERSELLQDSGILGGGNFSNNKGDLWKCCWQSSNGSSMATDYDGYRSFGVEEIFLEESKSLRYDYDLKTNKDELVRARSSFIDFIEELNKLGSEDEIKKFYESKMNVDLFLKTYACNVLLGMDDDYWRNHNNYYFYFDKNGKAYFIPYDYDNILGTNCFSDTATRNPLDWGEGAYEAPLIEKLLSVPEFKQKYVDYLLELSAENVFVTENQAEITRLQNLVIGLISSNDIEYEDTSKTIKDDVASWCSNSGKYKLLDVGETSNYFKAKAKSVQAYCNPKYVDITLDLNNKNGDIQDKKKKIWNSSYFIKDALVGTAVTNYYYEIWLTGYSFLGWFDAKENGNLITEIPAESTTLYAHWKGLPRCQIVRDLNGGSCKDNSSYPRTYSFYKGDWIPWDESISNGEKFFCGWYTEPGGGELVEYAIADMTVYAHYKELPYKYWSETTGTGESMEYLKFTFVPEDFNLSSDEIGFVVSACELNKWKGDSKDSRMTKNNDGTYTFTYSSSEYNIAGMWYGYKFVTNGVDWLGYKEYKYGKYLPEKYKQTDSTDANFLISELNK